MRFVGFLWFTSENREVDIIAVISAVVDKINQAK